MTKQNILFKTSLLQSHFFRCKLLLDFASDKNYVSVSLWSLSKEFFTNLRTTGSWYVLDYKPSLLQHHIEYIL